MSDELHGEIVEALSDLSLGGVLSDGTVKIVAEDIADALLPIIERSIAQARAETAEAIAAAIDDISSVYEGEVQRGVRIAALVVRKREEARQPAGEVASDDE